MNTGRQDAPGLGQTFGQQLGADQIFGRETQSQQLQQVRTAAAAHFEQPQCGEVGPAEVCEEAQQRALAFLLGLPNIGAQRTVAIARGAACVALAHGVEFAPRIVVEAHEIASMKRRASTG